MTPLQNASSQALDFISICTDIAMRYQVEFSAHLFIDAQDGAQVFLLHEPVSSRAYWAEVYDAAVLTDMHRVSSLFTTPTVEQHYITLPSLVDLGCPLL